MYTTRSIAANTWIWESPLTDDNIESLVRRVADLGFDAIELPVEFPGAFTAKKARSAVEAAGLIPTLAGVMPTDRNLVMCDPPMVQATQSYLIGCLELSADIGSAVVCGPFYSAVGRVWAMTDAERQLAYEELRDNLSPVIQRAEALGVALGIESLNRYETSFINTVDQALEALGPVFGPGLGLSLDTYHMQIEERSTAAAIERAASRIVHVQVCGNDRGAPGGDQTDWPAVLGALDRVGFDGILSIESFTAHNASIARAASIWRPLAPSQDQLASDGLAFLRELVASG